MTQHASDCAVHNAPAMEPGHCDCGATQGREALYAARGALKTDMEHTYEEEITLPEAVQQEIPGSGPYPTGYDIRSTALHTAKETCLDTSTTEDVIEAARKYEAYLKGE